MEQDRCLLVWDKCQECPVVLAVPVVSLAHLQVQFPLPRLRWKLSRDLKVWVSLRIEQYKPTSLVTRMKNTRLTSSSTLSVTMKTTQCKQQYKHLLEKTLVLVQLKCNQPKLKLSQLKLSRLKLNQLKPNQLTENLLRPNQFKTILRPTMTSTQMVKKRALSQKRELNQKRALSQKLVPSHNQMVVQLLTKTVMTLATTIRTTEVMTLMLEPVRVVLVATRLRSQPSSEI